MVIQISSFPRVPFAFGGKSLTEHVAIFLLSCFISQLTYQLLICANSPCPSSSHCWCIRRSSYCWRVWPTRLRRALVDLELLHSQVSRVSWIVYASQSAKILFKLLIFLLFVYSIGDEYSRRPGLADGLCGEVHPQVVKGAVLLADKILRSSKVLSSLPTNGDGARRLLELRRLPEGRNFRGAASTAAASASIEVDGLLDGPLI